ncbi:hypothetical protein RFI_28520 [Reticulomyxa filosa]|uniref:DNA-dependent protein kinase catalytic subunit n=1 Tax=Reticulomyxa filosa TaxID=46433 RepID=X6M5J1_RETFI|nr:hypothetical protein RFI_28520 [Reticulomyxa filosa]|eukprot:ETO08866.1 hypothetical protein RFI_28520 [Reticulomyxa filosa]
MQIFFFFFATNKKKKKLETDKDCKQKQLLVILTTVLKHIVSESRNKKQSKEFLSAIMDYFSKDSKVFDSNENEENTLIHLAIIRQYLSLCGNSILDNESDTNNKVLPFVLSIQCKALENDTDVIAQMQALEMLPLFFKASKKWPIKIATSLKRMIAHSFPSKSTTAFDSKVSNEWKNYKCRLDSLLNTLVCSESFDLLETLVPIVREKKHKHQTEINNKLDMLFSNLIHPLHREKCSQFLVRAIELFFDSSYDFDPLDNARRWMVECLCVPLLESAPLPVVSDFFNQNAKRLFDIILKYPNGPDRTKDHDNVRLQLLELECAYRLFAVQYHRLDVSCLTKSGVDYKVVIRKALDHVKKYGTQGKQDAVSQLAFHCAAYNCLAKCILRTQKQGSLPIWTELFIEKHDKGQVLWGNIIDFTQELVFSIDTNFSYSVRRVRRFLKQESSYKNGMGLWLLNKTLADSLISQSSLKKDYGDVAASAMTPNLAGTEDSDKEMKTERNDDKHENRDVATEQKKDSANDVGTNEEAEYVLELDRLNEMPTMENMLLCVDALHLHFQKQWGNSMPEWMLSLVQKLNENDPVLGHSNIKWFIAKLVVNKAHVFEPFAAQLFQPLVELCLAENLNTWGFHYFLRDICDLFLFKWPKFVPDVEIDDCAMRFVNHLIKMSCDFGDGTMKNSKVIQNVNYVKLFLTKWKNLPKVDKQPIYTLLTADLSWNKSADKLAIGDNVMVEKNGKVVPCEITFVSKSKGDVAVSYKVKYPGGLEESGVFPKRFYKRGIPFFFFFFKCVIVNINAVFVTAVDKKQDTNETLNIGCFFDALMSNFTASSKPVWKAAAKVYGDILRAEEDGVKKSVSFRRSLSNPEYIDAVRKFVSDVLSIDLTKAIEIMHRIANEYPVLYCLSSFCLTITLIIIKLGHYSKLMQPILGGMSKAPITCLADYVSLFAKYVSCDNPDPEVAIWLKPGLSRIFQHKFGSFFFCLFFELLPQFIENFGDHSNYRVRVKSQYNFIFLLVKWRGKLLGILCHIRDNEREIPVQLARQVNDTLLKALADGNTTNRKLMFEYWSHETRLQKPVIERLEDLCNLMFSKNCESLWLHYATFLLLEPMRHSTDFTSPISSRPLSECQYVEMNIDSQWHGASHLSQMALTPMFADNVFSQSVAEFAASQLMHSEIPFGFIQATQQHAWTQTQVSKFSQSQRQLEENHLPTPEDRSHRFAYGSGKDATFLWSAESQSSTERNEQDIFMGSFGAFQKGPSKKSMFPQQNLAQNPAKKVVTVKSSQRFSREKANQSVNQVYLFIFFFMFIISYDKKIKGFDMLKRYQKAWEERQKDVVANEVKLHRRYRKGELPDICIPHSDLQLPLQALHTDPVIAKQLFEMLFKAIYDEAKKRSDRTHNYAKRLEQALLGVLQNCNSHNSLVSSLFISACEFEHVNIHPKLLADLGVRSNSIYAGIVFLESMLKKDEAIDIEPPRKKRKISSGNGGDGLTYKERIYCQLSRLYELLGEEDTVLSLSRTFSKVQMTKDGIEAYLKGDYLQAYQFYSSAQSHLAYASQASPLEQQLWVEEKVKCLKKLAKWDDIYVITIETVQHSIDNVWSEFFETDAIGSGKLAVLSPVKREEPSQASILDKETLSIPQRQQHLQMKLKDWFDSCLKLESKWESFQNKLEEWLSPSSNNGANANEMIAKQALQKYRQSYIEFHFPMELAFVYSVIRSDWPRGKYYLKKSYDMLLEKWCNLPLLAENNKMELLHHLQKLEEINEFGQWMKYINEKQAKTMASSSSSSLLLSSSPSLKKRGRYENASIDLEDLLESWKQRFPNKGDDVNTWNDIAFHRNVFFKKMTDQCQDLSTIIADMYVTTLCETISALIEQKNYPVAQYHIEEASLLGQLSPQLKLQQIKLHLEETLDKYHYLSERKHESTTNSQENDKKLLQKLYQLSGKLGFYLKDEPMNDFQPTIYSLQGKMLCLMATLVAKNNRLSDYVDHATTNALFQQAQFCYCCVYVYVQIRIHNARSMYVYVRNVFAKKKKKKRESYQNAVRLLDDEDIGMEESKTVSEEKVNEGLVVSAMTSEENGASLSLPPSYLEMALFCHRRLLDLDESERLKMVEQKRGTNKFSVQRSDFSEIEIELAKQLIYHLLKAMAYGSPEAINLFPRVLEVTAMGHDLHHLVTKNCKIVPCWMFLRWIAQMLAELGSASVVSECALQILERIAKMYPNALVFPFNLTKEDLATGNEKTQSYMNRLDSILNEMPGFELTKAFTEALECMAHPNLKFKDGIKELRLIRNNNKLTISEKIERSVEVVQGICTGLFNTNKRYVKNQIGSENQKFCNYYKSKFEAIVGNNGSKVSAIKTETQLADMLKKIEVLGSDSKMKEFESKSGYICVYIIIINVLKFGNVTGQGNLSEFSQWLSNFDGSKYDDLLEMPGQYSGLRKPDPSQHLHVMSVDSSILTMGSLRRPKRIIIRTDDEREHMWLVKGGEDLRMDQRIEQLFVTMNEILTKDSKCRRKNWL